MQHGDFRPSLSICRPRQQQYWVEYEYLTGDYCVAGIAGKAPVGFSLYAPHDQAVRLHRVLDEHHIMTEILAI